MTTVTTSNDPLPGTQFIVASDVMRKFVAMAERVARHVGTVLISGETGTGKEMIAHTIHEHSLRSSKPLVEINCAALPENLVESELFGYEKGAFSGADSEKPGLFELAHQGTLFLDEIGELDPKVQVKLLRVLDRAPYYRLGGHRKIVTDVRVVAATNRDLKEEVMAGRFRKDLYHRLSQFELYVPPLRERRQDITALAEHFLAQHGQEFKFSPDALRLLESHSWPGNIRELQNVVNKVMVSASGSEIGDSEVRQELMKADGDSSVQVESAQSTTDLESLEAQAIRRVLEKTDGHRGHAAERLGISRRTLSRKLVEYGLSSARGARVTLGALSFEQQRSFRAQLSIPVSLKTAEGGELTCTGINLSTSGMGLEGWSDAPGHSSVVQVRFLLPQSETPVEALARVAWSSANHTGLAFTRINAAGRNAMKRWLHQKMAEEGWKVEADAQATSELENAPASVE